jgi:hypothetical protein
MIELAFCFYMKIKNNGPFWEDTNGRRRFLIPHEAGFGMTVQLGVTVGVKKWRFETQIETLETFIFESPLIHPHMLLNSAVMPNETK